MMEQERLARQRSKESDESRRASSRPRARTPGEMLARKQQLLGGAGALSLTGTNNNQHHRQPDDQADGLGSERERDNDEAKFRLEPADRLHQDHSSPSSATKLESLTSELVKINQLQQQQQQQEKQQSQPAADTSLASSSIQGASFSDNSSHNQSTAVKSIDDVYILLARKEKDLQLAAELGKVLLERNDELSKANERIAEEYSQKLELLEQEKHKLKRKLDLLDGEYENRLVELQTDNNILKNQLDQQQQTSRQVEKEKSKLIDDLVQQNQRLTIELAEATKSEELLSSQLEQVNERISSRLSNRQDHVAQVDGLQEEIRVLSQRKQDLERRLKLAQSDKSNLGAALEESGDKILLLEELLNERDIKVADLALEVEELRDSSSWLQAKLESMISLNERLANESEDVAATGGAKETTSHRERAQLIEQLRELRLKSRSRWRANERLQLAVGNQVVAPAFAGNKRQLARKKRLGLSTRGKQSGSLSSIEHDASHEPNSSSSSLDNELDGTNLKLQYDGDLLAKVYGLLRQFQVVLQLRKEAIQSTGSASIQVAAQNATQNEDSGISTTTTDSEDKQHEDLDRWRQLVDSLKSLIEEMPCTSCQLMIAERQDYEQLQRIHSRLGDELRRFKEENLKLSAETLEQAAKLLALEERCTILQDDLVNCDKPKEEIVRLAWKARDEAVGRKNAAEISLAKTRIENMQISSQLMEVVQQKGELSQKLAQFEDDIHYMTQHSVRAKFNWEECADEMRRKGRRTNGATTLATNATQQLNNGKNLLFNVVSSGGKHSSPTSGYSSINPLAHLLNFSNNSSSTTTQQATNANEDSSSEPSGSPSRHSTGGGGGGGQSLVQLTKDRFSLVKFWQKNAPTSKTTDQQLESKLTTNG